MSREQLERGLEFHQAGKLDEAEAVYQKVLADDNTNADALHFLGLIAQQKGDLSAAITKITAAIQSDSQRPTFYFNLGVTYAALNELKAAVAAYEKASDLKPDWLDVWINLGTTLGQLKQYEKAEAALRQAIDIDTNSSAAIISLAAALEGQGKSSAAEEVARQALKLDDTSPEAWTNLGNALGSQGKHRDAEDAFRQALAVDANYVTAQFNLGNLLDKQWRKAEALANYREAIVIDPEYQDAWQNMLLNLLYEPDETEQTIFIAHQDWAAKFESSKAPDSLGSAPMPTARLKIGYVSPDFRTHSCAYFLKPLFRAHDRENFEIYAYSNVRREDETTPWFKEQADHWRDITVLSDAAAAERIRADGINILVDLAGHSANNRLGIFALKPAPTQVSWLGYPATTGLPQMDYRITDAIADPAGEADACHSEKLVRLNDGFHCYEPADEVPPIEPLPALENGFVTFGSFNHIAKVTPAVLATWAEVLKSVPGSRLLLKGRMLDTDSVCQKIQDIMAQHGIAAERLALTGWIARDQNPVALYNAVDICLDSFPYNGTTTSFEALNMGVPVVTLRGDRHAGRVGASILTHLDFPQWIAESRKSYIELAHGLASDLSALQEIRAGLRHRLQQSELSDGVAFAAKIEDVYRKLRQ